MKATGIVRRVDDLGRIVIPKELRRILRIRENDPLELYSEDGAIVFKKYSPMMQIEESAAVCARIMCNIGLPAFICDTDQVIALGSRCTSCKGKRLAPAFVERIMAGKAFFSTDQEEPLLPFEDPKSPEALAVFPIKEDGSVCGAVVLIGASGAPKAGAAENAQIIAELLTERLGW